jgi:hypothetical protein
LVVEKALAEVGTDTHEKRVKYWTSALGRPVTFEEIAKLAWCGGFALWALHEAGLGLDKLWHIGSGFLLQQPHPLPVTHSPQPGDIGYQASPFQHHFVIQSVDGNQVHSIDGNQPDVARRTRTISQALTFYSIAPLLALVGAADTLPAVGPQLRQPVAPAAIQHCVNNLIMKHLLDLGVPNLLTVDGKIGPLSEAAIRWAQGVLGLPQTGNPDDATCRGLGLT